MGEEAAQMNEKFRKVLAALRPEERKKGLSSIQAWEEGEKSKADNRSEAILAQLFDRPKIALPELSHREKQEMGEEAEQMIVIEVEESGSLSKKKSSRKSSERVMKEVEHELSPILSPIVSPIQGWEEVEKWKADNRAKKKKKKKKKAITVWENSKTADLKAKLKKVEEGYEKKKAEYAEKIRNKIAMVHKTADEKRAMVDAKHGEEVLKAKEAAAKLRATGQTPKKSTFSCFGARKN